MATYADRGSGTPATTNTTWTNTANAVDGTPGANPATYTVWTNTTANAVGTIEVGGYDFSTVIGAGDTLNSVTVDIRHLESQTTRLANVQFQPYDGATPIGTLFTATRATSARNDSTTFPVTLAQLRSANFKVRVTATRFNGTQAGTFSLDHIDVTADYTAPEPAITQAAYQWFDEGTEAGAVALAAQDTAVIGNVSNGDATGTLRVRLQSTTAVTVPATDDWQLQYEKNTSGTWVNITPSSLAVQTYDSPNLTGTGATTNRLTGGTGGFTTGEVSEDGTANDKGWAGNGFTEFVYALKVIAADVVDGDTLGFRVLRNGATTAMTYSLTPTITIVGPQTWSGSAGTVGVAGVSADFIPGAASWGDGVVGESEIVGWGSAAITTAAFSVDITTGTDPGGVWDPLEDDQVFVFVSSQSTIGSAPDNAPAWVNLLGDAVELNHSGSALGAALWRHPVSAGEEAAGTTTHGETVFAGAETGNATAFVVRGVDPTDPIHALSMGEGGAVTPHVLPALTGADQPSASGCKVISMVVKDATGAYGSAPVGWATITSFNTNQGKWVGVRDAETTAGADVTTTDITPSAADEFLAFTLALNPAVVPGGVSIATIGIAGQSGIFTAAAVGGKPKVWSGSVWVEKPIKVWTGSAWVEKPLKVWTGSEWVLA